jgi:hypothetical protein
MSTCRFQNNLVVINGGYKDLDEFCVQRAIDMANVMVANSPYPDEAQAFVESVNKYLQEGIVEFPILYEMADDIPRPYGCLTNFSAFLVAVGEDVDWVSKVTEDAFSKLDAAADE